MTDIVERLRAHNPPDRTLDNRSRQIAIDIQEAADDIERLRELFRIDGEQHSAYVKTILHDQDTRLAAYKAEIERLRKEVEQWRKNDKWQREIAAGAIP